MKKWSNGVLLAATAVGLGVSVGALSAGFLHVVDWAQRALWETAPWADWSFAPLVLCTLGGLLVGLCQRYLGDHPKNIQGAVAELRATGRLDYTHLPQGVMTVGLSLIFGASLGPEAAIMDLLGGLMTWAADRLRAMRARFGFAQPDGGSRRQRLARQWSNLVALAVALFVFGALARSLYSGGFLTLSEGFVWSDLLWSIPLGALGALAGGLFLRLLALGQTLLAPLKSRPVLRAVLGGGVLGLLAMLVPMLLFSGQHDMQAVTRQAAALGSGMLLLIALARLALIALLLNSGWKGGQFLPLMFASAGLGLSVGQALPFLSTPVSILAVMAGLLAVVLPNPLISLALMALMFPFSYVGISAAAVLTVLAGKTLFTRRASRRAAQSPLQPNQSAQP